MPNPSPVCTVGGNPTPVDLASNTVTSGALASTAGVQYWSLTCTATDESTTPAAVNATLTVNQGAKTFQFTSPTPAGSCAIFQSIVGVAGLGLDANNVPQPSFTTTFKINVKAANGLRVVGSNEGLEQNAQVGWLAELNAAIRAAGGVGLSVTGTGFVHITGGSVDAAARAVNLASGDVTGVLPVANGGTGLSTNGGNTSVLTVAGGVPAWSGTGSNAQVFTITGGVAGWATPAAGVTWASDLSGNGTSTNSNQYVSSISYSSAAAGGPVAINGTGTTFVIAQANTGWSLSQTAQANASAPVGITFQPQFAGAGATSAANASPGPFVINFGPANNNGQAGTSGALFLQRNGLTNWAFGSAEGFGSINAMAWAGQSVTRSASNFVFQCDGTTLYINGPAGDIAFRTSNGDRGHISANGWQLFAGSVSFGGGVGVLGIADATTIPTSAIAGGCGAFSAIGGWYAVRGVSGFTFSTQSRTVTSSFTFDTISAATNPDGTVLVDTSGGAVTGTLPAATRGRKFRVIDKASTFQTNNFTYTATGGAKINHGAANGSKAIAAQDYFGEIESDGTDWYTS